MNRLNGTFPLRFPEFNTVWKKYRLGQLVDIRSAARVHKDEWQESGVPFFRTSDVVSAFNGSVNKKAYISENLYSKLIKKSGEVKRHDLLVTGGGSIGVPYLIKSNDPLYFKDADLLWIKSTEELYGPFLYQFLLSPIFRRYLLKITHTGTISHYTIEQAKATEIVLPKSTEQKKIADFLSAVDAKIRLLKEKHALLQQYKKGVMQKLFSQEIRFKEDNGEAFPDWSDTPVGEFMTESKVLGSKGDQAKKLTVKLWGKGVFAKDESQKGSENTQYYTRSSGQFIYSKLDFLNCAFGIVPEELDGYESTVDLPCFDVAPSINKYFILEYIKQKRFYKKFGDMADGSRKAKRIHAKDFLSFIVELPSESEQQKIAEFLQALDTKLDAVQQQIELTQTFKKGLLQQMFV